MTRVPHFDRAAMQRIRLEKGMSLCAVAKAAFDSKDRTSGIREYERGPTVPTVRTVLSLCRALGCSYEELVPAKAPPQIVRPMRYTGGAGRARAKEWNPRWRFD